MLFHRQLETFLSNGTKHLQILVPLIRRLSPGFLAVMEFRSEMDVHIAMKVLSASALNERTKASGNLGATRDLPD